MEAKCLISLLDDHTLTKFVSHCISSIFKSELFLSFVFQVVQYIGKLCRYLLALPYRPSEKQHSVRIAIGNGLRPQIWREFHSRFGISKIGEYYGSTEGNVAFFNIDSTPGACGFVSVILSGLFPSKFIKVDPVTGDLLRGDDGLAILAQPGEPGLAVGKIMKGTYQLVHNLTTYI